MSHYPLDHFIKEPMEDDLLTLGEVSIFSRIPIRFWYARLQSSWCPPCINKSKGLFIWNDVKNWLKEEMSINTID